MILVLLQSNEWNLFIISVEAANAGPGNLEVIVNNGKVPSTPKALGPSLYAITFVPKETEDHNIDIKFNGEAVPGFEIDEKKLYGIVVNIYT
jgi:hypothetical protein